MFTGAFGSHATLSLELWFLEHSTQEPKPIDDLTGFLRASSVEVSLSLPDVFESAAVMFTNQYQCALYFNVISTIKPMPST